MKLTHYAPPDQNLWTGRSTSPKDGPQYWYQRIELIDLRQQAFPLGKRGDVVLIGYACDEGAARNQGRPGAAEGPDAVRRHLAGTAIQFESQDYFDVGNVICPDGDMEGAQNQLAQLVALCLEADMLPTIIGGSHDMALGSYRGLRATTDDTIGIVNFDAHTDLRRPGPQGNSGTPFYQILEEENADGYLVIGVQSSAHTPALRRAVEKFEVELLYSDECQWNNIQLVKNYLETIVKDSDRLYVSVDLDGFSSAYAPGVSAPSPFGMEPMFVWECLKYLQLSGKLAVIDFAELNPRFDRDGQTAKLAARLIAEVTAFEYPYDV